MIDGIMAEAIGNNDNVKGNTLPQSGNVENVCRKWSVHEDGAFAYKLQNEEIDHHYGLNRFHRRTVRSDIPVAKVAQSDEEKQQQEERFQQLQALKFQAEEDEKVAQRVMANIMQEEKVEQRVQQIHDENVAKQCQENEKRKYERYLEKMKEQQLQKEREKSLEQHTQQARLLLDRVDANMGLSEETGELNLADETSSPLTRVTPLGTIEDDNTFKDFKMVLPDRVDDQQKKVLQEMQDEEIARLIQEQEHKRTKTEVDRSKLRDIEEQDAQLAKIMHEQEKLKSMKSKQRRQQREEARRQQEMQQIGDSNNMPSQLSPDQQSDAQEHHGVVQSSANGPAKSSETGRQSLTDQQLAHSQSSRQNSENVSSNAKTSRQNSEISRKDSQEHHSVSPQSSIQKSQENRRSSSKFSRNNSSDTAPLPLHPSVDRPRLPTPDEMQHNNVYQVEKWLAGSPNRSNINSGQTTQRQSDRSNVSDHVLLSPSPSGNYHSEDELKFRLQSSMKQNAKSSNIAAAIDPTFQRRQHEIDQDETEQKVPLPSLSQSLPVAGDTTRSNVFQNSLAEEWAVMNPNQPVQGHRRSTVDKECKGKKQSANGRKGSCKQQ